MKQIKMGSLFDGSGGFPLAGQLAGMTPVWASEVEPYPIKVTTKNFPDMKHLGSVTDIHGDQIEPVDVVTFGSPCQNLSVAGNRKGLAGEQSGLFFEAIRIIKEMREKTNGKQPRFAVWENVSGAFSSNNGQDFRSVLEELAKVKDTDVSVPMPEKGKWEPAGSIVGDGFSLCWRTLDAQFWGVPQRRKRIFLVCDFRTENSTDLLFEPESLHRDFEKGKGEGTETSRSTEDGIGNTGGNAELTATDRHALCLNDQGGNSMNVLNDMSPTLRAQSHGHSPLVIENHPNDSRIKAREDGVFETLSSRIGTGGGNVPLVLCSHPSGGDCYIKHDQTFQALTAKMQKGSADIPLMPEPSGESTQLIRQITPLECARLQGFPDWWTEGTEIENPTEEQMNFWRGVWNTFCTINGKRLKSDRQIQKWLSEKQSNSAKYKMWGNGIALPCVQYVLKQVAKGIQRGE